jgi:hypothetical protein
MKQVNKSHRGLVSILCVGIEFLGVDEALTSSSNLSSTEVRKALTPSSDLSSTKVRKALKCEPGRYIKKRC